MPPQVPTRIKWDTPSMCSSSTPMAVDGPPMPVLITSTLTPLVSASQLVYSRLRPISFAFSIRAAIFSTRPGSPGKMA